MAKNKGIVYLVGAGPGDHELLTLKGKRLLEKADVVVYDRLVNPKILALAKATARMIYVGKASSRHTLAQKDINLMLADLAKKGNIVVRLKGGDPFVFGRGGEEVLTLVKHRVAFEVVPGVTSAIAVPAYAGIPVTQRGFTSSLGIFTGQEDPTKDDTSIDWKKISTGLGTLVFLMGFENLQKITKTLIKHGRSASTACCLIQWGTLPRQRSLVGKLGDIFTKAMASKFSAPAILVVGEVVALKKKMDWFEKKPLFTKKILVTVPSEESSRLSGLLQEYGADCIELGLIEIKPLNDYSQLDSALKNIKNFDWLILTSQNGVRFFKQRLERLKKDVRIFKDIKIAAIGPKTKAALEEMGLKVDLQPKEFRQEGLLDALKHTDLNGKRFLIVRAKEARDVLPSGLKRLKAKVQVVAAYQTLIVKRSSDPKEFLEGLDMATFTSSSCVEGFFKVFSKKAIAKFKKNFKVASIGPVTSQTARRMGLRVDAEAKQYTLEGLVDAVVKYYSAKERSR